MNQLEFREVIENRLESTKELLVVKGLEYVRNNNPFHNFDEGAQEMEENPTRILDGFMLKHRISYRDILNDIDAGKPVSIAKVEEKIGDLIVYLCIQEALIKRELS